MEFNIQLEKGNEEEIQLSPERLKEIFPERG